MHTQLSDIWSNWQIIMGVKHLNPKTYYSPEFKKEAIQRVMIDRESICEVSPDLELSNYGTLSRWIKEYKENVYTVIERKKERNTAEFLQKYL